MSKIGEAAWPSFTAHDTKLGRDVAIRSSRRNMPATKFRARFMQEAEILARLQHPNIVPIYDSNVNKSRPGSRCGSSKAKTFGS